MNLLKFFSKFISKTNVVKKISNEELELLAQSLNLNHSQMNEWDGLFGTLCFNIWHNSNHEFLHSSDIQDIEIPFLCSIGVFQNFDNLTISKVHDIGLITQLAPVNVLKSKEKLMQQLPSIKNMMTLISSQSNVEIIKAFTSIFAQGFLSDFKKNHGGGSEMDYFQKGVEVLFLFIQEIRITDHKLFIELADYGEYQEDIDLIMEELNNAYLT
jgi:hypothetical protein